MYGQDMFLLGQRHKCISVFAINMFCKKGLQILLTFSVWNIFEVISVCFATYMMLCYLSSSQVCGFREFNGV